MYHYGNLCHEVMSSFGVGSQEIPPPTCHCLHPILPLTSCGAEPGNRYVPSQFQHSLMVSVVLEEVGVAVV